jgi:hypothetical protein
MVSIGSYEVAHDLLEKRKDIYDSRPRLIVGECICKGFHLQLLPFGAQWKTHRRLASNFLSNRQTRSYRHLQDVESKQLLYDLLGSNDFSGEFRRYNLSVIMTLAYGKRLEFRTNREIKEFTQISENIASGLTHPLSVLVDTFPILNGLPRWAGPLRGKGWVIRCLILWISSFKEICGMVNRVCHTIGQDKYPI